MRLPILLGLAATGLPILALGLAISDVTSDDILTLAERQTNVTAIDDANCESCESLLSTLQGLADEGSEAFVETITEICVESGEYNAAVCTGAIALEGPILAFDLQGMTLGSRTSVLFCLTLFGGCQWPEVEPYNVTLTPKPDVGPPASSGKTPIQVVHLSDIHVDLSYETGTSYNCTYPICCRDFTADPGVAGYPAGPYGEHYCDSPLTLEESVYAAIESLVPDRAFTIFTGDVVEGAVWAVTDTEVVDDLNNAYSRMLALGQTYAAVGNHDTCPVNAFVPAGANTTNTTEWAYDVLSSDWESWIGTDAAAEADSNFGSYSVLDSATGLRLISVNTNFWYKSNFWLYEPTIPSDPSGQLAWLAGELEAAEQASERVWILGHMPMGTTDVLHDQSQYFDQIIQRYDATIAAVFFGHTHMDEFEIAYSTPEAPSFETADMTFYIAPSLTPTSGNPSFRVYSVDPVTFGVLDYTVYYTNLSSPTYQSGPVWEVLYSVKEAYGSLLTPPVTDPSVELTPAFWHNVTTLFEENDDVFQQYYARKSRNWLFDTCTDDCKTLEICQLRASQSQYNCENVTVGISFKRDLTTSGTSHGHSECEGSEIIPIFHTLTKSGFDDFQASLSKKIKKRESLMMI